MTNKPALIVTSIAAPNTALRALAQGAQANGFDFIVIGDEPSPPDFQLEGCRFYSLAEQRELDLKLARLAPTRHYARKNLGYLLAFQNGAPMILETDDDNLPGQGFWTTRSRRQSVSVATQPGWLNVYRYFTDANIWPRGLPLDHIRGNVEAWESLVQQEVDCPIQQGLADDNPDVDAIYRLALPLPQNFRKDRRLALAQGTWCPFNSQNTAWWPDAFPLLYLPSHCSFRMTDIWRSFVAQRIAWTNDWTILFHEPNVSQERNEHNLMRDFRDEVPGYLNNKEICWALERLNLRNGIEHLGDNLGLCYEQLVRLELVGAQELTLLNAWLEDIGNVRPSSRSF